LRKILTYVLFLSLAVSSGGAAFAAELIPSCPGTPLDNSAGTYATPVSVFGSSIGICGYVSEVGGSITITAPSFLGDGPVDTFLGLSSGTLEGNGLYSVSAIDFASFNSGPTGGTITFSYSTDASPDELFYVLGGTVYSLTGDSIPVGDNVTGFGFGIAGPPDPHNTVSNIAFTPNATVPEPFSFGLLGLGLAVVGLVARRKRA